MCLYFLYFLYQFKSLIFIVFQNISQYVLVPYLILFLYIVILIFAVPIAYLFFAILGFIFRLVAFLGKYESFSNDRLGRLNNFFRIYGCNIILSFFLYPTIWIILQPTKNEMVTFFFSYLILTISFLLSLRFLSNPTIKGFIRMFEVWEDTAIAKQTKEKIIRFKENVVGFYFSIVAAALFYFIMFWFFNLLKPLFDIEQSVPGDFSLFLISPLPPISGVDAIKFICAFIIALFVATGSLELLLERWKPIIKS